MHTNVLTSGKNRHLGTFRVHIRQQWDKAIDAGHDTIAGWKDRSVGSVHATYGVTKIEADLQVQEFERIRRGYQLSLVE